jgi:hypothetical protein
VSPVKYELGFYIPEGGILHSHNPESLKSYITLMIPLYLGNIFTPLLSTEERTNTTGNSSW